MKLNLSTAETQEVVHSLRKYFSTELEQELTDLRAKLLLDYLASEIAPFAYNQGVKDAENYFRARLEDLPATCFEPPLTYWSKKKK